MRLIATGDTIITEHYTRDYKGYRELCDFVRSADVRFNNMETPLVDDWCRVSSFSGGHWLRSHTSLLDKLEDFGFNCYSFANNHNLDFFYDGMLSTLEAFEKRGLPYAGQAETSHQLPAIARWRHPKVLYLCWHLPLPLSRLQPQALPTVRSPADPV